MIFWIIVVLLVVSGVLFVTGAGDYDILSPLIGVMLIFGAVCMLIGKMIF